MHCIDEFMQQVFPRLAHPFVLNFSAFFINASSSDLSLGHCQFSSKNSIQTLSPALNPISSRLGSSLFSSRIMTPSVFFQIRVYRPLSSFQRFQNASISFVCSSESLVFLLNWPFLVIVGTFPSSLIRPQPTNRGSISSSYTISRSSSSYINKSKFFKAPASSIY